MVLWHTVKAVFVVESERCEAETSGADVDFLHGISRSFAKMNSLVFKIMDSISVFRIINVNINCIGRSFEGWRHGRYRVCFKGGMRVEILSWVFSSGGVLMSHL